MHFVEIENGQDLPPSYITLTRKQFDILISFFSTFYLEW